MYHMAPRFFYSLLLLFIAVTISSCERDDKEPQVSKSISRLYISYSDYQPDLQQPKIENIVIISNADTTEFGKFKIGTLSASQGGSYIYFHPSAQTVFHASINRTVIDTVINSMKVGETGQLSGFGRILSGRLKNIRSLVFHPGMDKLYAVNFSSNTSDIFVFDKPRGINRFVKTSQRFTLSNALPAWDLAIVASNLYTSRTGNNGGVDIFENLITQRDSIVPSVNPTRSLTVQGSSNIRGMSIDTVNNVMAMTDFVINPGVDTVGRILIFENFSELTKTTGNITPSRIITGSSTLLKQPVDVDLDFRAGSKYLYVADPASKAVYRFLKTANGNEAPDAVFKNGNLTPVSICLDARK